VVLSAVVEICLLVCLTDSIVQRNINGFYTRLLFPDILEEVGRNTG
jgi:hypothetical protein